MRTEADLRRLCERIDGRPYPAWRDLRGAWGVGPLVLIVDHVQGDPFAAPSRLRVRVQTGLPREICAHPVRRMAAEDWLLRRFGDGLRAERRGSGRSGEIRVYRPGPEIVRRSAVRLEPDGTAEVRFCAGLPARGRRVLGRQGWLLLSEDVPRAAERLADVGDGPREHIRCAVVGSELRAALRPRGLVAFIADGSILPRASGVDPRPLPGAVPFIGPPSLRVTLPTSAGDITGMGIPAGITLLVGGGFHGKSTVLHALQHGHLDHVPADGRERVVADPDTVKIRAEDGRRVCGVDISAFLSELPGDRPTAPFHTDDASGSTSQAAALVEAIESGARVLLMDEDTCATNLMVRDERMQAVVPHEPITPLVERIRALHRELEISCVLVVSGVGDYLRVADRVVAMDRWRPSDVTERAHAVAGAPLPDRGGLSRPAGRCVEPGSLRPSGRGRVRARDHRRIEYGREEIDLGAVEQVIDGAHAATLGRALQLIGADLADGRTPLPALLDTLDAVLADEGLDCLSPWAEPTGDLIWPRRHEVAAALNRLRALRIG